ncbi:hypothetical protein LPJ61_001711 [Coemansia biformis]|uniref:PH domain-containing protein n=1 Tax=Coemansia biformis TaxID=1286918 RepID=A0A9W8CZU0_9FUNG|nr:hypothetical protein LPJ61_001711 [Coemansia biformis]
MALEMELELELEQQQQQFQQQFLQQYHQMQQGHAGPHQDWVHDGFTGQIAVPPQQLALGFQNTPHNQSLSQHYAASAAAASPHATETSYIHDAFPQPPRARTPHRLGSRPWIQGHMRPRPAAASPHTPETEDSDTSTSASDDGDSASSDESAYDINSDEEVPLAAANSDTPASASRSASVARREVGPGRSPAPPAAVCPADAGEDDECDVGGEERVAAAHADGPEGASSEGGNSDDDDNVPLSVISSTSTHSARIMAVLRRSKTVAPPAAAAPRSAAGGTECAAPALVSRGSAKSRSLHVRSNCPSPASATSHLSRLAGPAGDDEDAPLDRLKADLVAGARRAPSSRSGSTSRAPSSASQRSFAAAIAIAGTTAAKVAMHNAADSARAPNAKTNGALPASARLLERSLRAAMASRRPADAAIGTRSGDADGSGDGGGSDYDNGCDSGGNGSVNGAAGERSNGRSASPLPPAQRDILTASGVSGPGTDGDNGSDAAGRPSNVPDAPACPSDAPDKQTPPAETRPRKAPGYLPTGTALPALVPRQRSMKQRAAVQYVALADMLEAVEEAQGLRQEDDLASGDGHHQHNKAWGAAGEQLGEQDGAQSVASFATVSSSGGTLMDVLRAGPVDLLTASTEHSGSKAAIDKVVPDDYGDVDQLLSDLDGIMNGSLAARRRFSLTLLRRSLAISSGLIEPADHSDLLYGGEGQGAEFAALPLLEFKPLEVSNVETGAPSAFGAELGLGDMFRNSLSVADEDSSSNNNGGGNNYGDDDTRPLDLLAVKNFGGGGVDAGLPTAPAAASLLPPQLELRLDWQPEAPAQPAELTRTQKIQKALEKLDVLAVRKVSIRIYVQDARRYYTFSLTEFTTCEMILNDMMKSGVIDPEKSNWALFELIDHFGIERPLNQFENLMSVVESWEPRSNNYLIVKGYSQLATLTLLGGVHAGEHAIQGMLYYRVKKNRWQKGVFCLHGHAMLLAKDGRNRAKREAHDLTLANNDIYTPFEPLRGAPTRFVFGLKSEMAMQMFERPDEDYVKWFAVQTLDSLRQWLQILRFSKNQIKFSQMLERRVVESTKVKPSEQKAPFKPLVELAPDSPGGDNNNDDSSSSAGDAAKPDSGTAAEIISLLSRTAASTKYDPKALLRVVARNGVDVSDFGMLGDVDRGGQPAVEEQVVDNLFQPGSLLSQAKKPTVDTNMRQQPEAEMFAKGSLLSQPRESKALAASRAMQKVMAQNGNVFAQGSLLEVVDEPKMRAPHVGGAPAVQHSQFPLVQMDDAGPVRPWANGHHAAPGNGGGNAYHTGFAGEAGDHLGDPVFGGLLARGDQAPGPEHHHQARGYAPRH